MPWDIRQEGELRCSGVFPTEDGTWILVSPMWHHDEVRSQIRPRLEVGRTVKLKKSELG